MKYETLTEVIVTYQTLSYHITFYRSTLVSKFLYLLAEKCLILSLSFVQIL